MHGLVIVRNRLELIEVVEDRPGKPGIVVGKNDKMIAAVPSDAVLFLDGVNSWQLAGELLIAASHAIERFKKAIKPVERRRDTGGSAGPA